MAYLKHYGVLGMKWGVRKARSYSKDVNAYRRRKANRLAKQKYKAGKLGKQEYKLAKASNRRKERNRNIRFNRQMKNLTPEKEKKIADIYKKYKDTAYKEIPNYAIKRGARSVAKAAMSIGVMAATGGISSIASKVGISAAVNIGVKNAGVAAGIKYGSKAIKYAGKAKSFVDDRRTKWN